MADMHGEAKYYSDNGTLLETRYYYNGLLVICKKMTRTITICVGLIILSISFLSEGICPAYG